VGVFDRLPNLVYLTLYCRWQGCTNDGNAELSCIPMLAALRARFVSYTGPQDTCATCTSPNATSTVCLLVAPTRCECTCNMGWTGPDGGGPCLQCAAGTYKSESGTAVTDTLICLACSTNSNSLAGSSVATACRCNAGWTGPNGGLCTQCEAGKSKFLLGSV